MNNILFFVIIIFTMLIKINSFAQVSENKQEWTIYKEVNGLQIYSKDLNCNDDQNGIHNQFVCFQFINTTSETMSISWQFELWYNNNCITCGKPANNETSYKINLAPDEMVEGDCSNSSSSGLKIFSSFINTARGSKLSKFEYKNLEVTFK